MIGVVIHPLRGQYRPYAWNKSQWTIRGGGAQPLTPRHLSLSRRDRDNPHDQWGAARMWFTHELYWKIKYFIILCEIPVECSTPGKAQSSTLCL